MVFELAPWQRGTAGVGAELVRRATGKALEISADMPQFKGPQDLEPVHDSLGALRAALRDLRQISPMPSDLPGPDLGEMELALWALGLARHLTKRRSL